ncbi:MAG: hypothetical protein Q7R60_02020 [bacterium]|nr:hypothetical protein [bacterium]
MAREILDNSCDRVLVEGVDLGFGDVPLHTVYVDSVEAVAARSGLPVETVQATRELLAIWGSPSSGAEAFRVENHHDK